MKYNPIMRHTLFEVKNALEMCGYDPLELMTEYLTDGDDEVITPTKGARQTIKAVDRDMIIMELLRVYLSGELYSSAQTMGMPAMAAAAAAETGANAPLAAEQNAQAVQAAQAAEQNAQAAQTSQAAQAAPSEMKLPDPKDISVMIVDDAPFMRNMLKMILSKNGYNVVGELESGAAAIEALKQNAAQVVMLDMTLPDEDAIAVVKELLAVKPDVNIIMLTTLDIQAETEQAIELGAKGILARPFDEARILFMLRRVLSN